MARELRALRKCRELLPMRPADEFGSLARNRCWRTWASYSLTPIARQPRLAASRA